MRRLAATSSALGAACVILFAAAARAEGGAASEVGLDADPISRPHTMAVLEGGIIILPTAPIAQGYEGGSTPFGRVGKGDATIDAGLHVLFRASPAWAFGAGVMWAPDPTSDTQYGGVSGLSRTHARSYFDLFAEARYFPIRLRWIEGWVGLGVGRIAVADRFGTNAGPDVPSVIGTKEVTLSSEGLDLQAQIGADYMFANRWVVGANFRWQNWILPKSPRCSDIGDCTTLLGFVGAMQVGINLGYRIPL